MTNCAQWQRLSAQCYRTTSNNYDFPFSDYFAAEQQCTISNVEVTPCPEAAEDKPCRVKKGRSVSIAFDMQPSFSGESLESQAYWATGRTDLPLIGMDTDGCKATTCPIVAGTTQRYQWSLDVDKKFPSRQFNVKMKVKTPEENFCCFMFNIKLTK